MIQTHFMAAQAMDMLKKVAIVIGLFSFLTFIVLFGRLPAFRNTPIGFLNRQLRVALPALIIRLDESITSGRGRQAIGGISRYLFDSNHPLVLAFFMLVLLISEIIFIPSALPRLSQVHIIPIFIAVSAPFYFTYMASRSSTSKITRRNHNQEIRRYPYDNIIFVPKNCDSCHFLKPARSKHCSLCNACVSKHDHHCIWLRNCVGMETYRHFLALLLSVGLLSCYGSVLAYDLLSQGMRGNEEHPSSSMESRYGPQLAGLMSHFDTLALAIAQDARIGGVGLLCLLTSPLTWGLLAYHLYLLWAGMTTNESSKWAAWRDDISAGCVVKKRRPSLRRRDDRTNGGFQEPTFSFKRVPEEEVSVSDWIRRYEANGWTSVKSLDEMQNIYDLGFKSNLVNVIRGV